MRQIIKWSIRKQPQALVCNSTACDKIKLRETPKTCVTSFPRIPLVMVKNAKIYGQSAANWYNSQQVQRLYGFGRLQNRLRDSPSPIKYVKRQGNRGNGWISVD